MQVTETKAEGLKLAFKVVLESGEIDEKMSARLEEVGQQVRIPGFRPGKVPPAVLKQRYGQSVMGEVIENAVNDSTQQALAERNLRPAMQPRIEITSFDEGADLEYTIEVEVLPEIALPNLGDYELTRRVADISEKDVDEAMERVAKQYSKSEPISEPRPAESGDILVIDFVGRVDGTEFPGGSASDHHLELGSNSFVQGFEDQLVGAAPGDQRTVKITFPAEYVNDQLAGKEAEFDVTIKEIHARVPIPVDDELAKMIGMDDLEAMRAAVRGQMEDEFKDLTRAHMKREILDKLAELKDFDVPQSMLEAEFETIWQRVTEAKAQGQLDEEEAAKSDDELEKDYREISERRVRLGLLISEIGRLNNVSVSQDEMTQAVFQEARRNPGQESEVFEFYKSNPEALASLRAPVFEDKVIDYIIELAKVTDVKVAPEDLLKDPDELAESEGKKAAPKKAPASKTKTKTKKKSTGKSAKKD